MATTIETLPTLRQLLNFANKIPKYYKNKVIRVMQTSFNCPLCETNNWYKVKKYHHENQTNKSLENNYTNHPSSFINIRQQILFDVWFPSQKKVVLTSIYCKTCGFMCYSPRPNKDDLQAKYKYLSERGNIGILSNPTPRALRLDRQRELFINKMIAKHHNVEFQKVLDVGGGDGRFLRPFLEERCSCYVVDFNPTPYPKVQRIGSTLDDIPSETFFDILICSHVLEHVSDPGEFLRQLCSILSDNGVVYIEVPLEIWQGIPINRDPVTHINFFTVSSLRNGLLLNGLQPLSIESKFSPYDGKYKRVAWAVASAAELKTSLSSVSSIDTRKLIEPKPLHKLSRKIENFWIKKVLNSPVNKR